MSEQSGTPGRIRVLTSLLEAVLAPVGADGIRPHEVEVVCIRPGLSKNGNFYGRDVVRSMVPLFEGARAFADHPAPGERPERSVRDLVGYYKAPRIDEQGALRAILKVTRNADWLYMLIEEALADGRPDLVGISIDADARVRAGEVDGRAVRIVESVTRLNSCDVVTRASAGGALARLRQADNGSWWDSYEPANEEAARAQDAALAMGRPLSAQQIPIVSDLGVVPPVQLGPTAAAAIPGGRVIAGGTFVGDPMHGVSVSGEGGSMPESIDAGATSRESSVIGPPTTPDAVLREAQEELARTRKLLECERTLAREMAGCTLPAPVKARLEKRFGGRVFEADDLHGAIAEERELLAALTDAGLIRGMGYEKSIRVGMTEAERIQKAFDQLFDIYEGEKVPALSGIREAYVAATGDPGITGITAPERLREADVTTSSFSFLLGTSMNKRLLKDYQAWPSEWQKFCTITPIKDFKQQDRIRLGAFGSLSTVAEDTAYTTLTLADTRATYTPAKRGNLVAVTRETIVNDDLYAIKQIPGKLAVSAAFTLAEFVYGFLTATSNIYDANPLFTNGGAHKNSAVVTPGTANTGVAFSSSAMQTGVTAMRRQTNLASKPIGLKPRFLIVPPELEWAAMVITKSAGAPGANYNDINPMLGYCEVIVAPQLASATFWTMAADPRVIDTIEIGFVGGQVNPILFVQDQPLYGNNFTNDVITYKVRHEYGGAVVDYRGFYQGNN